MLNCRSSRMRCARIPNCCKPYSIPTTQRSVDQDADGLTTTKSSCYHPKFLCHHRLRMNGGTDVFLPLWCWSITGLYAQAGLAVTARYGRSGNRGQFCSSIKALTSGTRDPSSGRVAVTQLRCEERDGEGAVAPPSRTLHIVHGSHRQFQSSARSAHPGVPMVMFEGSTSFRAMSIFDILI